MYTRYGFYMEQMSTAAADLTDEQYEIGDRIADLIDADPSIDYSPSQVARKVKTETTTAATVLGWMVANRMAVANGNGAWTRYSSRR